MSFQNKVVIITGATQGIGRGVAEAYAALGAHVVLSDLNDEKGAAAASAIEAQGGSAIFIKCDVRMEQEIIHLMKETKERYGHIDILINNAGVSRWKSPYELTVDEWDDVMNTNVRSSFIAAREAAKVMRQNEKSGGSIVNIASTRAIMSEPNSEAYAASKGAIVSLTHALAVSLGKDGIMVNCISPGWIETSNYEDLREEDHAQHPSGRVGTSSDIAKACLYLTDPGNQFVTGSHLIVDGGMTRKMIYFE